MAHEWWNAATGRAAMRTEAAATNDRPCKLVKPKKAALAAGLLVSYTLATKREFGTCRDSSREASWKLRRRDYECPRTRNLQS